MYKTIEEFTWFVDDGEILFVNVTADWFLICKFNQIMGLYSSRVNDLYQIKGFISMINEFKSQYDEIYKLLQYYNRIGITFYIVYVT